MILHTYIIPKPNQIGFQESQSLQMDLISAFYGEINFYLIVILTFVTYMLCRALWLYTSNSVSEKLTELHTLEFVWTLVPAVILAGIAIPSFLLLYQLDSCVKPHMTLRVIGHQWYWTYEATTVGEQLTRTIDAFLIQEADLLHGFRLLETTAVELPVGVSIRCLVTSSDVLHSWALPSLGIKIDAVPGRLNQIAMNTINHAGSVHGAAVYGQCSELCGSEHGHMPIKLILV